MSIYGNPFYDVTLSSFEVFVIRLFSALITPLVLLVVAIFLSAQLEGLPDSQLVIIKFLPLFITVIGMSLCLRFNRSLVFFAMFALTQAYILMQWHLPGLGWVERKTFWNALCVLLPFNVVLVSLLRERGMLTPWGSTRFLFLLLPMLIVAAVAKYYPEPFLHLLTLRFVDLDLLRQVNFAQLPLLVMLLAILALNGRWFLQASAQNSALFIALLCAITMLYFKNEMMVSAIFASAALLMLAIAVIQESWSMAYIDQLTNLPGRRALEEDLLKLGSNYAIAMMDIDHFKKFNDTYGHDAGDQVLRMVAARISQSLSTGKAYRYGGEEFTLIFPGKKVQDVLQVLENVRESIGGDKFQLRNKDRRSGTRRKEGGKRVDVTISIGVADSFSGDVTPHTVIKNADKALYKAKKQGRNRVSK